MGGHGTGSHHGKLHNNWPEGSRYIRKKIFQRFAQLHSEQQSLVGSAVVSRWGWLDTSWLRLLHALLHVIAFMQ